MSHRRSSVRIRALSPAFQFLSLLVRGRMGMARAQLRAMRCPRDVTKSTHLLAPCLTDGLPMQLKVWSLFIWTANNIRYDYDSLKPGKRKPQDADSVLTSRLGVCAGFSHLMETLIRYSDPNILCYYVCGLADGAGGWGRHAWNVIRLDGRHYILDVTFAATGGSFSKWFCPEPRHVIQTHYPDDDHWQLLDPPVSFRQFLKISGLTPSQAQRLREGKD